MKFNYPIKYAAMPIKDCDMTYYIVSKCYLINDTTKYDSCGYSYKDSEVVFPYQLTEHEKWERVNPKFSCLGYCTNSNKVDDLFDTYEEALKFVATKNEESFVKIWECVPFTSNLLERINKERDEFDAKLLEYKVLEQKIMDCTNDLKIGTQKRVDEVIMFEDNKLSLCGCDFYTIIEFFPKCIFYTVSKEQYNKLISLIGKKSIDDIKSIIGHTDCLLVKEKRGFIKLANKDNNGVYYIDEDKLIKYSEGLKKISEDDLKNIERSTDICYTTETFDDIVKSYKKYEEIESFDHVLKKVKKQY